MPSPGSDAGSSALAHAPRILAVLLLSALRLAPTPFPVAEHTFVNGLKLLVHEDHDIPNVALYFFFRVGTRNEVAGTTGISHFLEHMMFNGTEKIGPRQFDITMEKNGGSNNAYTTPDITVFSDWLPRSAVVLAVRMEADRIQNLWFDPKMIESERGVISAERRSTVENDNFEMLLEQLYGLAYTVHPYRWPVIGRASDIASWTMADLKEHFRFGYSPSNCLMIAVGDVTDAQMAALARKYLEPIPNHGVPPAVRNREPKQPKERRRVVTRPAQAPMMLIGYHVPPADNPEYWQLQAALSILTEGRSSRLYRHLVTQSGLALSVNSWQPLTLDPGLAIFSIDLKSGGSPEAAERVIEDELSRLASHGVSAREMTRAKNELLTEYRRCIRSISGEAELLGQYEIYFGDFRRLFSAPDDIRHLTTAGVQRVAARYLVPANKTVATLLPELPRRETTSR